jgi:hypothetical protein
LDRLPGEMRLPKDSAAGRRESERQMETRRLRQETTMALAWIAQRLHMGVWSHVSNLLRVK